MNQLFFRQIIPNNLEMWEAIKVVAEEVMAM